MGGQDPDRGDEEPRACASAILEADFPAVVLFVEGRCGDIGIERDVAPQVEFVIGS